MKTATTTSTGVMPFYFGLVTAKFYDTWAFYTEGLGFRTWEEDDDHVVLAHFSGVRLSILRHETNEQHAELVSATDGRGLWLNLEVADVDAIYERLCAAGVPVVQPLKAGPRGMRFFVVHDPNGVLVRIARAQVSSVVWAEELEMVKGSRN